MAAMRRRARPATTGTFSVRHAATARDAFGPYEYDVLLDGEEIGRYWHDYRGDAHGIRFVDGTLVDGPLGRMTDFLQGGGPEPLTLSPAAVAWLAQRLAARLRRTRGS